jgi:hypothetical protein
VTIPGRGNEFVATVEWTTDLPDASASTLVDEW